MKPRKKKALCWALAGLVISLLAVLVVFTGLKGVMVVTDPQEIPEAADAVMTCIREGDFDTLETLVSGDLALKPQTGEEGSAQALIWEAYCRSLQWSRRGGYRVQDTKATQAVTVTCLDIAAFTGSMKESLPEATEQALAEAAKATLAGQLPMVEKEITMTFTRTDGQWKLLPDNTLLALLSGFMAP